MTRIAYDDAAGLSAALRDHEARLEAEADRAETERQVCEACQHWDDCYGCHERIPLTAGVTR